MAGGPIFPLSAVPVTAGKVFPVSIHAERPMGLGVMASLDGDAIWRLFYRAPPALPTGTPKQLLACHANATTGNVKPNVKWKSYGANEVPAAADLTAEGVGTITFATTAYRETQLKITLDADTWVAGELIMIDLTFETSGHTLAQILVVQSPAILWE